MWYKPTIRVINGDTGVFIKTIPFITFTREFIKGEGAKQKEPLYKDQIKKDSVYIASLTRTNEFAASEIINQTTQKDSIKTQATVIIADVNKKADARVKRRTIVMSIGWIVGVVGAFIVGTKF